MQEVFAAIQTVATQMKRLYDLGQEASEADWQVFRAEVEPERPVDPSQLTHETLMDLLEKTYKAGWFDGGVSTPQVVEQFQQELENAPKVLDDRPVVR